MTHGLSSAPSPRDSLLPSPFMRFTLPVTKNISASSHSVAEEEGHEFITIKTTLAPASLVQGCYLQCIDSEQPFGKKRP